MSNIRLDYRVRPAQISDLILLGKIERSASTLFEDTPYPWLVNSETVPLSFVYSQFQVGQIWVAVDRSNMVVGFVITCNLDRGLYLKEIDVDPTHGNRGIGKMLVKAVLDWARPRGYHDMFLSTFRDIPWNAPFYTKLGFSILDESALTTDLQEIRKQEELAGLPILNRVIMYITL